MGIYVNIIYNDIYNVVNWHRNIYAKFTWLIGNGVVLAAVVRLHNGQSRNFLPQPADFHNGFKLLVH